MKFQVCSDAGPLSSGAEGRSRLGEMVLGHQAGPGANSLLLGTAFLIFHAIVPNKVIIFHVG